MNRSSQTNQLDRDQPQDFGAQRFHSGTWWIDATANEAAALQEASAW